MQNNSEQQAWNGSCPVCHNKKAYNGLNVCECPNESCSNYSKKQKDLVEEAQTISEKEFVEEYSEYYKTMDKIASSPIFKGFTYNPQNYPFPVPANSNNNAPSPDSVSDSTDKQTTINFNKNQQSDSSASSSSSSSCYDYYEYDDYHPVGD